MSNDTRKTQATSDLCALVRTWSTQGLNEGQINSVLASVLDMRLKCNPEASPELAVVVDRRADEIRRRAIQIIGEQLGISVNEITDKSHLVHDLGADSLDTVELLMALEDEFEIEIPDADAEGTYVVDDIVTKLVANEGIK